MARHGKKKKEPLPSEKKLEIDVLQENTAISRQEQKKKRGCEKTSGIKVPAVTKKTVTISLTSENWREAQQQKKDRDADSSAFAQTNMAMAAEPVSSILAGYDMLGKSSMGWRAEALSVKGHWLCNWSTDPLWYTESLHQRALQSDSSPFFLFPSQHPGGPAGNLGFAEVSASAAGTQKTVPDGTQCTPGGAWLMPGGP